MPPTRDTGQLQVASPRREASRCSTGTNGRRVVASPKKGPQVKKAIGSITKAEASGKKKNSEKLATASKAPIEAKEERFVIFTVPIVTGGKQFSIIEQAFLELT